MPHHPHSHLLPTPHHHHIIIICITATPQTQPLTHFGHFRGSFSKASAVKPQKPHKRKQSVLFTSCVRAMLWAGIGEGVFVFLGGIYLSTGRAGLLQIMLRDQNTLRCLIVHIFTSALPAFLREIGGNGSSVGSVTPCVPTFFVLNRSFCYLLATMVVWFTILAIFSDSRDAPRRYDTTKSLKSCKSITI